MMNINDAKHYVIEKITCNTDDESNKRKELTDLLEELYKYKQMTDFIGGFNITVKEERQELIDMVNNLLTIEIKNNKNQELVTKFSSECEEYQKKLDQIDELALLIENAIKKIRGKI